MSDTATNFAICGGLRSGKDTVGELLVTNHKFKRFAFGDPIKELCWKYFPERMEVGKDRALLQGIGQDLRGYDSDVWIRKTFENVGSYFESLTTKSIVYALNGWGEIEDPVNIVITDLRQPNELEKLRANGFFIVRVNADVESRKRRAEASGDVFVSEDLQHDTESHFDSFIVDYELNNNGTLADLAHQVETMYLEATRRIDLGGSADGSR